MNTDDAAVKSAEERAARRGLIRQVVVQGLAVLLFWWAVNALVMTVIEIYEDFDLELSANTLNFVTGPGPVGVGAVTLGLTLLMAGMLWLPASRWAGWLASLQFLATVCWLALVALFAVTPLLDMRGVLGMQ